MFRNATGIKSRLKEYVLTFGGLVPPNNIVVTKDKEEHISMRDLQDMIKNNLRVLKEKQTEESNKLATILNNIENISMRDLQDMIKNNLIVLKEKQIEESNNLATILNNIEKIPKKSENTIEKNPDATKNSFNKFDMHAEMKEKLQAQCEKFQTQSNQLQTQHEQFQTQSKQFQTQRKQFQIQREQFQTQNEQFQTQNKQFQSQSEQFQRLVEMFRKSEGIKASRKKVRKDKPRIKPSQKTQETISKSTPAQNSDEEENIFSLHYPNSDNSDSGKKSMKKKLISLKHKIKIQRQENASLVDLLNNRSIMNSRNNETCDTNSVTSSEPGYYYFIE